MHVAVQILFIKLKTIAKRTQLSHNFDVNDNKG